MLGSFESGTAQKGGCEPANTQKPSWKKDVNEIEQVPSAVMQGVDMWSVGCILGEMARGRETLSRLGLPESVSEVMRRFRASPSFGEGASHRQYKRLPECDKTRIETG